MSKTPKMSIYESTFVKSDKTDATLLVNGKKLHVNRTLLSCHSDYFKTLFNSEFKEKSMEEIEIKGVKFEDFATLLSLVQDNPLEIKESQMEPLIKLADQFLLPNAKRHVELFICSTQLDKYQKLKLADNYNLDVLLKHTLLLYKEKIDFYAYYENTKGFSQRTKSSLFERYFQLFQFSL
ncbi:unnamed protein product [Caenorhabditis brenneri]